MAQEHPPPGSPAVVNGLRASSEIMVVVEVNSKHGVVMAELG